MEMKGAMKFKKGKREIIFKQAAESIREMSDTDACKLAEMLDVRLSHPDLHASRDQPYPLPQIIIRASNPQTKADIAVRYHVTCNKWVGHRDLVRAFLERITLLTNLEPLKRSKAGIALEMLDVADNRRKLHDWKERLNISEKCFNSLA